MEDEESEGGEREKVQREGGAQRHERGVERVEHAPAGRQRVAAARAALGAARALDDADGDRREKRHRDRAADQAGDSRDQKGCRVGRRAGDTDDERCDRDDAIIRTQNPGAEPIQPLPNTTHVRFADVSRDLIRHVHSQSPHASRDNTDGDSREARGSGKVLEVAGL